MKSRELFAVAVRIVGLVSLIYMLSGAWYIFNSGVLFFVRELIWLIVSLWLIRGAPQLVQFAYSGSE